MHPFLSTGKTVRAVKLTRLVTISSMLLVSSPILAAETDTETVIVTGTRQAARANELLNEVSVITRDEIEKASPMQTLGDLLARQGGVEFVTNGPPGTATSIFIRGANANHTLLLVDGMRVGSATSGASSFSSMPLAQIERVEILKGSASSLYGSDAIGGVIQVFTKRGEGEATVNAEVSTGTDSTTEGSVGISGKKDRVRYSLRVGGAKSDGFSAITNSKNSAYNSDEDDYKNLNASGQLSVDLAPGHEVGIQTFYSRNKNQIDATYYDASFSPRADYDFRGTSTAQSYAVYSRNKFMSNWTSLLRLGRSEDENQNYSAPGKSDEFKTTQDQFVWQNDITLPFGSLLLGAERLKQTIDSTNKYAETERTVNSLLGGWTGNLGNHRVQLNARQDRNSQYGNKTTGGAAYGYQITDQWRARAGISTGFKAPTFNDLYYPGAGNKDLQPETSRNREIGLNYDTARSKASLTVYRNDIDNLIAWAPIFPGSWDWLPFNVDEARISGATLTGQHQVGNLTLRASFDMQDPKNQGTDKYLARRAKRHGSIGFDHQLGRFNWGADLLASGMRYDDAANKKELGGYATLALRAEYRLDYDLTVFAKAGNVLDKEYELAKDYGVLGRSIFIGLRYQPK